MPEQFHVMTALFHDRTLINLVDDEPHATLALGRQEKRHTLTRKAGCTIPGKRLSDRKIATDRQ